MKPGILFAVFAIFLYAAQNVVLERKLVGQEVAHRLPQLTAMVTLSVVFAATSIFFLVIQWQRGSSMAPPTAAQWGWILVAAGILFVADLAYFTAYASGVSVSAITTTAVLLPVFAAFVGVVTGGRSPNWYEIAAIPFATIAVLLVARGQAS